MRRIKCNHCGRVLHKLCIEKCDDVGSSGFEDTDYSVDEEGFIELYINNDWANYYKTDSTMKDDCETVVCPYCLEPIGDYMEVDYCCQPMTIGSSKGYEIVHEGNVDLEEAWSEAATYHTELDYRQRQLSEEIEELKGRLMKLPEKVKQTFLKDIENISQRLDHIQPLRDGAQEVVDRVGLDGKLVCPNCGKKMPRILVRMFMQDGGDKDIPTDYIYENGLIRFETDENWAGYYFQDDATDVPSKEMLGTIFCPFCLKNFESDYISISEPLDVALSIKSSGEKEG